MRIQRTTIWSALVVLVLVLGGCSRDARLAGRNVRTVKVAPVTHYGMTLDENATPAQVAFVALRAIRDDFHAATPAEREIALQVQFEVCAADSIEARNGSSISRDEFVYNVVYHWTPTVSHYVDQFETDWHEAEARLVQSAVNIRSVGDSRTLECDVRMALKDPKGNPNGGVVMIVWMAQDQGLWRVAHVGFDRTRRTISDS